jgi:hypothetical protein
MIPIMTGNFFIFSLVRRMLRAFGTDKSVPYGRGSKQFAKTGFEDLSGGTIPSQKGDDPICTMHEMSAATRRKPEFEEGNDTESFRRDTAPAVSAIYHQTCSGHPRTGVPTFSIDNNSQNRNLANSFKFVQHPIPSPGAALLCAAGGRYSRA